MYRKFIFNENSNDDNFFKLPSFEHEIVKYNPKFYKNGIYINDEWVSMSEIGNIYNGKRFTIEEYLAVEQKYIDTILSIMQRLKCKYLIIDYIEIDKTDLINNIRLSKFPKQDLPLINHIYNLETKNRIYYTKISPIIKLALRDYIYVIFSNNTHKLQFDISYNLYLNINCNLEFNELKNIVTKNGLFLDPRNK